MSTLYIKEHANKPQMAGGPDIWAEPALAEQRVTVSGTSAQSAAFNAQTKFITITCDGIYSYLCAADPTALTTSFRVPADQIISFAVTPGQKIAAITNT